MKKTFSALFSVLCLTAAHGQLIAPPYASGLPISILGAKASDATAITPIILYVKSVTVLTSGTPADVATINIPSAITRWSLVNGGTGVFGRMVAETASGTLAGATFTIYDAAAGGGNAMSTSATAPTQQTPTAGCETTLNSLTVGSSIPSTSSTLYIRQNANSANAGTISFYIALFPLP